MPLAGKGMLLTSMDIDPSDEVEFNRWYDREHLEERVAIDGFLEARRYVAHQGSPKYLCLYSTGGRKRGPSARCAAGETRSAEIRWHPLHAPDRERSRAFQTDR